MANDFFKSGSYAQASASQNTNISSAGLSVNSTAGDLSAPASGTTAAAGGVGGTMPIPNPYVMAAKFAINYASSQLKQAEQLKSMVADAKLQRAGIERNRSRVNTAYSKNMMELNKTMKENHLNSEIARLEAESGMAVGFAGSGLSGTSVEDINSVVLRSVAVDRMNNQEFYTETKEQLNTQYDNTLEDLAVQSSQIGKYKRESDLSTLLGAAGGSI